MTAYIVKRLLQLIPVGILITMAAFLIFYFTPGDPVRLMLGQGATLESIEEVRARLGLDEPMHVQYLKFLGRIVRGDLGTSYINQRPVTYLLAPALHATVRLTAVTLVFTILIGIPVGIIAATRKYSSLDYMFTGWAILGISAPVFWIGLILMYVFAYQLRWLPSGGMDHWYSVLLPALTMALHFGAALARMTRSCMLEVMTHDYIRTARSKGVSERRIHYKHALYNAGIPIITLIGLQMGHMLTGAVLTETVFAWPGVGRLIVNGIFQRDAPTVQAALLVVAMVFALVNLLTDILYTQLNPVVRYGRE